jgi:DNA-binding beta-propeller fold protein YncE
MREKSLLRHFSHRTVLISFVISIILASSPLYLLPLVYSQESSSQELSYIPSWRQNRGEIRLSSPSGVALDQEGNVYVADTGNDRIQVFSSNGTFISQWARPGEVAGNGTLRSPQGIAVDSSSGNVYVADTGNDRIRVFSSNGTFISQWTRAGNGTLRSPQGIAVDSSSGNVYVTDTGNNRIQVFSSNGTFISRFGIYGTDNGSFIHPEGVALDQEGNVYVADTGNNRIQVFSSNGTFISQWGEYGQVAANGTLRFPQGIAVDSSSGNVYVADTGNNRIQVFSSNGTFISQWGEYGSDEDQLRFPQGIAVDSSSGNVYVTDTGNDRISAFSSSSPIMDVTFSNEDVEIYGNDTSIKIELVYDGLDFPTAIAFLGPDDMLILQRQDNRIMRIVNGQMLNEPVLDLGNTVKIQGCMCGLTILQNYNSTSYAFLYYYEAEVPEDDGTINFVNRLYRYDITNGKFTNPKLFFEISNYNADLAIHHGGKVMVGPDNNIYLTLGDLDSRQTKAQNVKSGSLADGSSGILRFTPNGEPVDNGLLGDVHPLDKYYAYGVRNSFGIDYDPLTGNIWMTDNGPNYGDELNILKPGFNGGWNEIMGFSSFNNALNLNDLEFFNGTGKYYDPAFEWFESIGVTDLLFVSSDKLGEEYEGNLFVGEANSGYLYRFVLDPSRTGLLLNGSLSDRVANNYVERLEAAFAKIKVGGITDLEIGPDGLVYIVSGSGKIMRLEPMDTNVTLPILDTNVTDTNAIHTAATDTHDATEIGATGATRAVSTVLSSS